jgi:outer membrane protein assembly factor BamB
VLGLPSPAYADGLVVAGFGSGDLIALRGATGAVVWGDSLASARGRNSASDLSAIHGMPVIQDGRVYAVGLGGLMLALDLRSGRRLWERDVTSDSTPCVAGDWIYVLSAEGELAALSRIDGSVAWVTLLQKFENMEKKKNPIRWMGPTLAADRLVVASSNAKAQAVSPYTGEILGEQELSGAVSVPAVVAMGTVFLVTDDAKLVALR